VGDERRDFDNPGRTNGQHDQTEPVPPQDDTQAESPPEKAGSTAETQPFAAPDETQAMAPADQTQPYAPLGEQDETRLLPEDLGREPEPEPDRVWSGRAGVAPRPGPSLRDSAPYGREAPRVEEPRPWWTPLLLGLLALGLLGVLILVAYLMGRDNSPAPVDSPTASAVEATTPGEATTPPTAPVSPTSQLVQIPRLVGLPLDDAVAQLDLLGLAYRFEYRQADEPQGTVIAASPPEGTVVPIQATVSLTISTGRNSPPPSPSPSRPLASATPTS